LGTAPNAVRVTITDSGCRIDACKAAPGSASSRIVAPRSGAEEGRTIHEVPAVAETDRNSALIREFYAEVFNQGHTAFADRVHGPGYRYHDITVDTRTVDHETYMARNAGFAAAFPDRTVTIEDLIASADRVVARAVLHATHTGPLGDVAPTGRPVHLASTIVYRFADGRVIEEWEIFDKLGMYQQLGVAPPALPDE
jgi:steroid delta-isomerase-like uncharacterized protein